jgi:hypothetical protein
MCTVLLPLGANPIAVNKYIKDVIIIIIIINIIVVVVIIIIEVVSGYVRSFDQVPTGR